jgi:hypothetical protein
MVKDAHNRTRNATKVPTLDDHRRVLATIQRYENGKWSDREVLATGEDVCEYPLRRGGMLKIYPGLLSSDETIRVKKELLANVDNFRLYRIQGINDEPRCHFLLHEDATEDDSKPQPGYRYGNTTMKARPLGDLPILEALSTKVAQTCQVDKWTIGVNPIVYRDGKDRIGPHAGK